MLKQRAKIIARGVLLTDLLLVAVAFGLSYWLRSVFLPSFGIGKGTLYSLGHYLPLLPLALGVWAGALTTSGLYRSHRVVPLRGEVFAVIKICAAAALVFTGFIYVLRLDEALLGADKISRSWLFLFVVLVVLLLLLRIVSIRLTARYFRLHGYNFRSILILGTGESAISIAESVRQNRYWGYRILGYLAESGDEVGNEVAGIPVLGSVDDIPDLIGKHVVDEVIIAQRRLRLDRLEETLLLLEDQGVGVRFCLNLFPKLPTRVDVSDLDGIPMMTYSTTIASEPGLMLKRFTDITVSTLLLLLLSPVIALVALAIRLADGSPVLFRQTRCGLNGRRFTLLKFRTMVHNAEQMKGDVEHLNEMNGPVFKVKNDPRATPLGRILRKISLDELPQFWNVLKGDMSLVGPRPPVPTEVERYERWQRRRLSMRPGLTCLWQVGGRSDIDFDRWMELDLKYIDSWSMLLDLKILLLTVPVVLTGKGAS